MLYNKILVNIYALKIDENFEIYIPIDEKVGNIISLIGSDIYRDRNDHYIINTSNGRIYNNNDLIRNTDIKNGSILICM